MCRVSHHSRRRLTSITSSIATFIRSRPVRGVESSTLKAAPLRFVAISLRLGALWRCAQAVCAILQPDTGHEYTTARGGAGTGSWQSARWQNRPHRWGATSWDPRHHARFSRHFGASTMLVFHAMDNDVGSSVQRLQHEYMGVYGIQCTLKSAATVR